MKTRTIRLLGLALALAGIAVTPGGAGAAERSGSAVAPGNGLCELLDLVLTLDCGGRSGPPASGSEPPSAQQQGATDSVRRTSTVPRYDPRRLGITFRRGVSRRAIAAALNRAGVTLEQAVPAIRAYMVGVEPGRRAAALASLRASPAVASAGQEVLADALDTGPNDADWPQQWGLRLAGFPQAWSLTHGSKQVVVAVVDTGVDPTQPDLRGALVAGYDFVNHDTDASDDHGHGTAVAGIIAARADNREGIAGICWSCSIMPVKVLDHDGVGDDSVIAAGIVWAADHGARVINLSLGGPGATPDLGDAVAYAVGKGAIVIAAAGNSGATVPFYPAADPHALGVAASTGTDQPYPWSNFGPWVSVAAPGCNVAPSLAGGYEDFCGTSSATPVVSGVAALAFAADPNASTADVQQALEHPAAPIAGFVQYGRINAPATLSLVAPQLTRPTAVFRATLGGQAATRSYTETVAAGRLTATLRFRGAQRLWLLLVPIDPAGPPTRVAGRSPLRLERVLPAGTVRLVVGGRGERASFVLSVT